MNKYGQISGYTPKVSFMNYTEDIYAYPRGTSWVWGSWKNRWFSIDWEIKEWNNFRKDKKAIKEFEKTGNDMFKMP